MNGSVRNTVQETSGQNTIERNVIPESGEHDAHDDSGGAGMSGTANFWINNCETEYRFGLWQPRNDYPGLTVVSCAAKRAA
jgi:hypothetical protein